MSGGTAITHDGLEIKYDVYGKEAPSLVFVHGLSCNRTFWKYQIPRFSRSHQCVTIDLSGHGESGSGRTAYTMAGFGEDVAQVVKTLNLKEVVLLGHSMGGPVIIESYKRLAGCVIGLIGVETFHRVSFAYTEEMIQERIAPFRDDFVRATESFRQVVYSDDPSLSEFIIRIMTSHAPEIGVSAQEEMWRWCPMVQHMKDVTVPIYAIIGDWFDLTDMEGAKAAGVTMIVQKGRGHFNMMEDPVHFNNLLVQLIKPRPVGVVRVNWLCLENALCYSCN